VYGYRKA